MIRIFDENIDRKAILNREIQSYTEYEPAVREILENVRAGGDGAVLDYSERFDKVRPESLEVPREEMLAALERLDKPFRDVLSRARDNITAFHEKQKREGFRFEKQGGIVLGQKFTPLERVGIYVPGGTASYPSTVLMNAIPAKIAGVKELVMVTPPNREGRIRDEILGAAALCGVDRVFRCGGAQAIAALAYGTESVPAVDKIVGPGNIFVAIAKKMVFGKVGIDMIAGPSEILVLADETARPSLVAADLLSQAEHDKLATAVLVTESRELAAAVQQELERQIPLLERAEIARESIDRNGKIIVMQSMEQAVEISNAIAPEHLEICMEEPFRWLEKITNAGSVFLGKYTPEPLGDYFAGPNHTLPTGGSARFSSPLSVDDFVKKSSFLYYPEEELQKAAPAVSLFARREGLTAHARSVEMRTEDVQ